MQRAQGPLYAGTDSTWHSNNLFPRSTAHVIQVGYAACAVPLSHAENRARLPVEKHAPIRRPWVMLADLNPLPPVRRSTNLFLSNTISAPSTPLPVYSDCDVLPILPLPPLFYTRHKTQASLAYPVSFPYTLPNPSLNPTNILTS